MKGGPEIWRNSSSPLYKPILWFSNLHLLSLIRTSAKLIKINLPVLVLGYLFSKLIDIFS
jgi:hypothetical protein